MEITGFVTAGATQCVSYKSWVITGFIFVLWSITLWLLNKKCTEVIKLKRRSR